MDKSLTIVHELSKPDPWRYDVKGEQNPMDYASRKRSLDNEIKINESIG